jgi:hypothetical protein
VVKACRISELAKRIGRLAAIVDEAKNPNRNGKVKV